MGRWEPGARGRLIRSALELYSERGFEQTTAGDIAERAGVTERTFFRHFADKREVLFDGSNALQSLIVDAIDTAPAELAPLDTVVRAMSASAEFFNGGGAHSTQRTAVISANPSLQERELLKFATLTVAVTEALQRRGVPLDVATVAAGTGASIFRMAFDSWIAANATGDFADYVRGTLAQLRALTAG